MHKTKWFTLGAAAALFSATPAFASDAPCSCCSQAEQTSAAKPAANHDVPAKGRRVDVSVTKDGFVPAAITAKKGEVLNLVVTRRVEQTCATELVQKEQGINAPLPFGKAVTVTLKAPQDGQLTFSCAHGHIAGNIVTQ